METGDLFIKDQDDALMEKLEGSCFKGCLALIVAGTLFFLFVVSSCTIAPFIDPDIIPIGTPVDTTQHVDTLQLDTCDGFHEVTSPDFVGFWKNKDVNPVPPIQWLYIDKPIDIDSFFATISTGHRIYYSGQNIGGILDGTLATQYLNGRVLCVDGSGARHSFAFYAQGLYPAGCMTFEQFWFELTTNCQSVRLLNLRNTGYTCEQYVQLIEYLLQDCKAGRCCIYLGGNGACIPQELLDECVARGWIIYP